MKMFYVILVVALWCMQFSQLMEVYTCNGCSLSYGNYSSVKLIKQLPPTGPWKANDMLSNAEVLGETVERIKMLGMCQWVLATFRGVLQEKGELRLELPVYKQN